MTRPKRHSTLLLQSLLCYSSIGTRQSSIINPHEFLADVQNPSSPSINTFFDKVLVMADDKALRENRLALVYRLACLSAGIADLSKLEGF